MSKSILTHSYLKEHLHYSIITGKFYWIKPRQNIKVLSVAGNTYSNGYRYVELNGKAHRAHRLAWFWVTGEWPVNNIDHKNGVRDANYWLNIRNATSSQNQHNKGMQSNNKSGFKGVSWDTTANKWRADIRLNCKSKFLGFGLTPEEAHEKRLRAEKEFHGEFARAMSPKEKLA